MKSRITKNFSKSQPAIFILVFATIGYLVFRTFAAPNPNLQGDLNNDNTVNITDLSILLSNYGTTSSTADINGDSTVNILDLSILLSHYGQNGSGVTSPSGQAMPTGDVTSGGHTWHQVVAEDFTKDAALGTMGSDCDPSKVVYTGANGIQWHAYPKCYPDTYQHRAYRSDAVNSVHDGVLDFWLHIVDGHPAGANLNATLPSTGSVYQSYGRYEVRFRTTTNALGEYYQAWLLWPSSDINGGCAESDYPESQLNATNVSAFAHYCDGSGNHQDYANKAVDRTQWHTYTQEWMPGKRNYYLDGVLIGSSTNQIWNQQERWQLQTETNTTCDQVTPSTCHDDGHLLVDWAVVYSY